MSAATQPQRPLLDLSQIFVTPQIAQGWLDHNKAHGRPNYRTTPSGGKVIISKALLLGHMNGVSSIIFDEDGFLIDGFTRSTCCVHTGRGFWAVLIGNAPCDSVHTIDRGIPRRLKDVLAYEGYASGTSLASVVNLEWRMALHPELAASSSPVPIDSSEALDWLVANPRLSKALSRASYARKKYPKFSGSAYAVFLHQASELNPIKTQEFHEQFISGFPSEDNSQIRSLVNWANRLEGHSDRVVHYSIITKAWNLWMRKKPSTQLSWRKKGDAAESIPLLLDTFCEPHAMSCADSFHFTSWLDALVTPESDQSR